MSERLDPPKEIIVDHCRGCLLEIYVGDDCLETEFGPKNSKCCWNFEQKKEINYHMM